MEILTQAPLDPQLRRSVRRALSGNAVPPNLDADALCDLLVSLDVSNLPQARVLFGGVGPAVTPLFRGLGAELLLVRWEPGQSTDVVDLGDAAVAVRPLSGRLQLQTFRPIGRRVAELRSVLEVVPGQLAGVPRGSVHAFVALEPTISLQLCSPPVVLRTPYDVVAS